jgi:hypothetical protein
MQGARSAATETVHEVRRGNEHRATPQTTPQQFLRQLLIGARRKSRIRCCVIYPLVVPY